MEFIEKKFRPIGSYAKHCLKKFLSVACKAILFLLQVVVQTKISICSAVLVQHKFQSLNARIRLKCEDSLDAMPLYRKVDIDNFFNKIKH